MKEALAPRVAPSRVAPFVRSLTWPWTPRSEREAGDAVVRNFVLHWFPNKVSRRSLSTTYSLWLGTISALLFFLLTATGLVLMFLYVPSVERSYASIKDLEYVVSFGRILRSTHRVSAHLMVGVVFLHMVRVFLTGAYRNGTLARQHRPVNWWIGMALLLVTLLLSFTGYLLPWDQLAYWAITVGTNIARSVPVVGDKMRFLLLGGNEINQATLIRFYVLHCFLLPAALGGLFAWHMWRIRKDGGLACRDREALDAPEKVLEPSKTKTWSLLGITSGRNATVESSAVEDSNLAVSSPLLVRRLLLVCLVTVVATLFLSAMVGAPLEEPANPMVTPNPAKAPWYFLWLQELVTITTFRLGSVTINGAFVGGILVPGIVVGLGVMVPWFDKTGPKTVGVWFARERLRHNVLFLAFCVLLLVLTVVGTFLRGPYWHIFWPWQSWPVHPPML